MILLIFLRFSMISAPVWYPMVSILAAASYNFSAFYSVMPLMLSMSFLVLAIMSEDGILPHENRQDSTKTSTFELLNVCIVNAMLLKLVNLIELEVHVHITVKSRNSGVCILESDYFLRSWLLLFGLLHQMNKVQNLILINLNWS